MATLNACILKGDEPIEILHIANLPLFSALRLIVLRLVTSQLVETKNGAKRWLNRIYI